MNVADILQGIATATFVGAFAFGVVQVLNARRTRREQAAIEIVHSMQNGPFARAWRIVLELPAGISAADLEALGPEVTRAADEMAVALETLGYLVFRRIVPLEIVNDLVGGVTVASWDRMRDWVEVSRQRTGNPRLVEWQQWLSERLMEQRVPRRKPAHEQFKQWEP